MFIAQDSTWISQRNQYRKLPSPCITACDNGEKASKTMTLSKSKEPVIIFSLTQAEQPPTHLNIWFIVKPATLSYLHYNIDFDECIREKHEKILDYALKHGKVTFIVVRKQDENSNTNNGDRSNGCKSSDNRKRTYGAAFSDISNKSSETTTHAAPPSKKRRLNEHDVSTCSLDDDDDDDDAAVAVKCLEAHLVAQSQVFAKMLSSPHFKEFKDKRITFHGSELLLMAFVRFIITGMYTVKGDVSHRMLELGHRYEMRALQNMAVKSILLEVNIDTFMCTTRLFDKFDVETEMIQSLIHFGQKHLLKLKAHSDWKHLSNVWRTAVQM
eukprot:937902_1